MCTYVCRGTVRCTVSTYCTVHEHIHSVYTYMRMVQSKRYTVQDICTWTIATNLQVGTVGTVHVRNGTSCVYMYLHMYIVQSTVLLRNDEAGK